MAINLTSGFSPKGPWPLDDRNTFSSYEEAYAFVQNNPTAYEGQLITVGKDLYIVCNTVLSARLEHITPKDVQDINELEARLASRDLVVGDHVRVCFTADISDGGFEQIYAGVGEYFEHGIYLVVAGPNDGNTIIHLPNAEKISEYSDEYDQLKNDCENYLKNNLPETTKYIIISMYDELGDAGDLVVYRVIREGVLDLALIGTGGVETGTQIPNDLSVNSVSATDIVATRSLAVGDMGEDSYLMRFEGETLNAMYIETSGITTVDGIRIGDTYLDENTLQALLALIK